MDSASIESGEQSDTGPKGASAVDRAAEWVKVDGDRLLLTFVVSVGILAAVLALNAVGVIAFENPDSVTRMASGMIAGTFSLVTIVVSVNQLILSQEFSPAGSYREQLSGVMEFREDIEKHTGVSSAPIEPTRILRVLTAAIERRADELTEAVEGHSDKEYERRVREYAERLERDTKQVDDRLEGSGEETFDALSVAVDYDNAWHLSTVRSLRNEAPASTEEMSERFDGLMGTLRLFSTAQEHFKTVYLQRELTRFSQLTIYCGVPSVLSAVLITLLYGDVGGSAINVTALPPVTAVLVTIIFVPLVLLAVYILRTATLTRRTAATGPILSENPDNERPNGGDERSSR